MADEPVISVRRLEKRELPPRIHRLRRPITPEALGPLDPRCQIVQFREPLEPDELRAVSAMLRENPGVGLRVYGFGRGPYPTLDFLEHFPELEYLEIECYDLQDISRRCWGSRPQLAPEHFQPFVGHPTLAEAAIEIGSKKKSAAVDALLGLPGPSGPPSWLDLS